jgi:hydroxymethylpyrimidine kinase / phosphomethylpyrimidine kinase / thiamine-phosphate diphosphorylase
MTAELKLFDKGLGLALQTTHAYAILIPAVLFEHDLPALTVFFQERQARRHAQGYAAEDAATLALFDISIAQHQGGLVAGKPVPDPTIKDLLHFDLFPRLINRQDQAAMRFAPMVNSRPGVYPIVDRYDLLEPLMDAGAQLIQLRIKSDQLTPAIDQSIRSAIRLSEKYPASQLFINDYWQSAIEHGAYGIHLGQEDLQIADLSAIEAAGIRLGVSSHAFWEVARAATLSPSYIACGPVFPTRAKAMPWIAQGTDNLTYWTALLPFPVIGIGGINAENLPVIHATGCAGASVIQAVVSASDPALAYQALQGQWQGLDQDQAPRSLLKSGADPSEPAAIRLAKPTLPL